MVRGGCARAMLARRYARAGLAFPSLSSVRGTKTAFSGREQVVLSSRRITVRLVGERGSARAGCEGRKEVSFLSARLILSEHLLAARPEGSSRGLERYGPAARLVVGSR